MDTISLERIDTLHPKLRDKAKKDYLDANNLLGKNVRLRISYAKRSFAEQAALYAQGRETLGEINRLRHIAKMQPIGFSESRNKVTNAKAGESYHNYGLACFSSDTRVFTKDGLKYFYELNDDDEVLTFKNDNIEYQKPIARISNDYEGEMVRVLTRSTDLLVTPNHKMVVKRKTNTKWDKNWSYINAEELDYKYKIPTSGNKIDFKNIEYEINEHKRKIGIKDSLAFFEFMGYWLSEGSVAGSKSGIPRTHSNRFKINISQVKEKNPETWQKIYDCLTRLNIKFRYSGHDFSFHNKGLWEYLFKIGNSYTKYIPSELLNYDQKHLELLYNALIDGDGSCGLYAFFCLYMSFVALLL